MKYILVALFFCYVLFISFFSLQEFPAPNNPNYFVPYLSERPLSEDGFYSLKVAWNIGRGEGIVYNYYKPTTGIQPLYVFTASILSYVNKIFGGDKFTFLRMIIILSGIISIVFAFVIKKLSQKILPETDPKILFSVSILLVLFNFKIFLNLFNGLETGLYLVLLGLCINYSYSFFEIASSARYRLLFGLLIGITILARIDFLIIASVFIITLIILKKLSVIDSLPIIIMVLIVISPWFMYVYSVQGSLIPSSALVQSAVQTAEIGYRIDQFFFSLASNIVPFYHTGLTQTFLFYPVALLLLVILVKFQKEKLRLFWKNKLLRSWLIGFTIITSIYLLFAAEPYFYFRYISIWSVVTLPFFSTIIARWLSNKSKHIFQLVVFCAALFFFSNVFYYLHYPKIVSSLALRPGYIEKHFKASNIIGMPQSGISGYFYDNVINLDGKVNHEALEAIKTDNLLKYISDENIDVIIEWREWFEMLNSKSLLKTFVRYYPDIGDDKTLVYIKAN